MTPYFTSDLHIGHRNIAKYRDWVDDVEDNTEQIMELLSKLTKRDVLYVLGDCFFDSKYQDVFKQLPCRKILILGNHDYQYSKYDTHKAFDVFDKVHGFIKYKEFWLSHCPVTKEELRGKINLHGHDHSGNFVSLNHFNVNIDVLMKRFNKAYISLEEIREYMEPIVLDERIYN